MTEAVIVPGKKLVFMPCVGGFANYRRKCADIAAQGYPGLDVWPSVRAEHAA